MPPDGLQGEFKGKTRTPGPRCIVVVQILGLKRHRMSIRDRNARRRIIAVGGATFAVLGLVLNLGPLSAAGPLTALPGPRGNGLIAFVTTGSGNSEIDTMMIDGANPVNVTNSPDDDADPAWSPNGRQMAFTRTHAGNSDVYPMKANGTAQTRLTTNTAVESEPTWSPDGAKIAFTSSRDGNREIYSMSPTGANQTRLTTTAAQDSQPAWSPDGTKIAFISSRDGNQEIYAMSSTGTSQIRLTNNPGPTPSRRLPPTAVHGSCSPSRGARVRTSMRCGRPTARTSSP
jgi:dipeptidyl aminopeptidase/acylaminoacyl peptidase